LGCLGEVLAEQRLAADARHAIVFPDARLHSSRLFSREYLAGVPLVIARVFRVEHYGLAPRPTRETRDRIV
jgi:hypothetical protein